MQKFTIWSIVLFLSICVISFVIAILWHIIFFKYFFQFLTSLGFLLLGFYYILRARVPNNIGKGLFLILLSPVAFYASNLFFVQVHFKEFGTVSNINNNALDVIWNSFLNVPLSGLMPNIRVWHIMLGLALFGNALVIGRKPKFNAILAVNLLVILFTMIIFVIYRY